MTDHPSSYYLQKLDCNCNDCWYMKRDLPRYNQSLELHLRWQREAFENAKQRLMNKAREWEEKGKRSEMEYKVLGDSSASHEKCSPQKPEGFTNTKEENEKKVSNDKVRDECNRKARNLRTEAGAMRLQQDKKEAMINYGHCTKFDKPVTFMPGILQLDTQECFEHRKDKK